jgi:hypothetical protein
MPFSISRRDSTRYLLAVLLAPLVACKRSLECTDTNTLSAADLDLRVRTLRYRDRSEDPARTCSGCQQFKPHGEDACGACVVVRGPINPRGQCAKWAAKPA